jgi:hypothetical protein
MKRLYCNVKSVDVVEPVWRGRAFGSRQTGLSISDIASVKFPAACCGGQFVFYLSGEDIDTTAVSVLDELQAYVCGGEIPAPGRLSRASDDRRGLGRIFFLTFILIWREAVRFPASLSLSAASWPRFCYLRPNLTSDHAALSHPQQRDDEKSVHKRSFSRHTRKRNAF